ncbi:MAG: hypothetical protein KDB86_14215 [Actinobacteria bacterium]|nr:hypothetical protein [Actinomycetota bacterium]MCB9390262.1 hypothetical protein [Acidimicrobiia bacterium]
MQQRDVVANGQLQPFTDYSAELIPCLAGAREHAAVVALASMKVVVLEAAFFFEQAGSSESTLRVR